MSKKYRSRYSGNVNPFRCARDCPGLCNIETGPVHIAHLKCLQALKRPAPALFAANKQNPATPALFAVADSLWLNLYVTPMREQLAHMVLAFLLLDSGEFASLWLAGRECVASCRLTTRRTCRISGTVVGVYRLLEAWGVWSDRPRTRFDKSYGASCDLELARDVRGISLEVAHGFGRRGPPPGEAWAPWVAAAGRRIVRQLTGVE